MVGLSGWVFGFEWLVGFLVKMTGEEEEGGGGVV